MKRTRADFKWLKEKLEAEFPERSLTHIDKGDLNKKVIEDYFKYLFDKEHLGSSRYLTYFLTADDRMFEERKNSEESIFGGLINKLKKPGVTLEDFGVGDVQKSKVWYN